MRLITLYVGLLLLVASCAKEVKIDIPGYEKQFVIDGTIETDQPPLVFISTNQNIYAPTDLNSYLNSFVSGAEVTVSDGTTTVKLDEICTDNLPPGAEEIAAQIFGIPAEDLSKFHLCAYTSFNPAIFGKVGKSYSLTVKIGEEVFTSSTSLLTPVGFNKVFWKEDQDAANHGFSWVEMTDPIGQYDAYFWEVKRINLNDKGEPKDQVFKAVYSPVFDDQFFDGKTFELGFENPMTTRDSSVSKEFQGYYKLGDSVVIKFSKIDENSFNFLERKYLQLQTAGNPFASPTTIPSNISGGALGSWIGYSPYFDTLVCKP